MGKIGRRDEHGALVEFPTETLSGASYDREIERALGRSLPGMVFLDGTRFVVLDANPPKDFDRRSAIEELRGGGAKAVSRRVVSEPETTGG